MTRITCSHPKTCDFTIDTGALLKWCARCGGLRIAEGDWITPSSASIIMGAFQ